MAKTAKVWTPKQRAEKAKAMREYWKRRNGSKVPPQAEITAELRKSEFWKVEGQPPGSESLRARLVKLELAAQALREALAAL